MQGGEDVGDDGFEKEFLFGDVVEVHPFVGWLEGEVEQGRQRSANLDELVLKLGGVACHQDVASDDALDDRRDCFVTDLVFLSHRRDFLLKAITKALDAMALADAVLALRIPAFYSIRILVEGFKQEGHLALGAGLHLLVV